MPTRNFTYTGSWQPWEVPDKVDFVTVIINGAGSGKRPGGRVEGRIRVKGVKRLFVAVGGKGDDPTGRKGGAGGWNGGGAGGDGTRGNAGGWGGGGASAIRADSKTGPVRAVAAGAGGDSGDGARGGQGGREVGESGYPAPGYPEGVVPTDKTPWLVDYPNIGNATGGTQEQAGNGGTSSHSTTFNGHDAARTVLGKAGAGGSGTNGGGGGGGGYWGGGGGQAGFLLETPGGSGAGGSNFADPLISVNTARGEGGTGNGSVVLSWVSPPPANQPPNPPTDVEFNGKSATDEAATLAKVSLRVSAKVSNRERHQDLRLVAVYSADSDFVHGVRRARSEWLDMSPLTDAEKKKPKNQRRKITDRAAVLLTGLQQDRLYYLRLYTQDRAGALSINYASFTFWTNRAPNPPTLYNPGDNATVSQGATTVFEWSHDDRDTESSQAAFRFQFRRASTANTKASKWVTRERVGWDSYWTEDPENFKANNYYEWRVKTRDPQGAWGEYAEPRSFFVEGVAAPPVLLSPSSDEAVDVSRPVRFVWRFRDPKAGATQAAADLRYRSSRLGSDWVTLTGTTLSPGGVNEWLLPEGTLTAGVQYEWQARTRDGAASLSSQWSDSETFWSTSTPEVDAVAVDLVDTTITGSLGCGTHRAFIYDRGGTVLRGEVTPLTHVSWTRKRDDIGSGVIDTNGFSDDCGQLLSEVRCWVHELVIFRDGVRVFEGPITRITYSVDSVEIEAKDVMAYVYRRIMRQGYNDAYRVVNGEQLGLSTVVERAARIIMNALAPDDPNVLRYLTALNYPDDARISRSVDDYTKTAWEEVDDLAATAGLDYITVGRRIILSDTHRPIGRLPELRDKDFSDPPVVTEYGMQTATYFAVTNNGGVYGDAAPSDLGYEWANQENQPYGRVEQLASAYGETEGGTAPTTTAVLTRAARTRLEDTLAKQARRNLNGRWPTPMVVRVPDNSSLSPESNVQINDLVPGVWVPLRSRVTVRELSQWQKLDVVTVDQSSTGERVMVTLSPAPNFGEDPDSNSGGASE